MADEKPNPVRMVDSLFHTLLQEATSPTVPDEGDPSGSGRPTIGFTDRLALFNAAVKWVAVKNKVDPDDEPDQWQQRVARYNGGAGGRGGRPAKAAAGADAAGGGARSPANGSAGTA